MDIKDMSLSEIETRFADIKGIVESRSDEMAIEELEALNKEVTELEERKIQLNKIAEERAALIEKAKISTNVIAQPEERGKKEENN